MVAFVQTAKNSSQTSVLTLSATFSSTVGNGNAVVGSVVTAGAQTSFTVTDDKSNTYTVVNLFDYTTPNKTFAQFYCTGITNAPQTITVSYSVSQTVCLVIDEFSGIAGTGALDASSFSEAKSTSPKSGSVTTTQNGDLIYGSFFANNGSDTLTAGSGFTFTSTAQLTGYQLVSEYEIQSSAGSIAATGTISTSVYWICGVMALFAGSSSSVVPSYQRRNIIPRLVSRFL